MTRTTGLPWTTTLDLDDWAGGIEDNGQVAISANTLIPLKRGADENNVLRETVRMRLASSEQHQDPAYLPFQTGSRFSAKAREPYMKSSDINIRW